jgi:hypothetical protein
MQWLRTSDQLFVYLTNAELFAVAGRLIRWNDDHQRLPPAAAMSRHSFIFHAALKVSADF